MKKTLYSVLLDEGVVREIDRLAHRNGLSRSSLVNQILAEYVDMTTPERRIGDVFRAMEDLLRPDTELVPFFAPNAMTMSMKSALDYKYRPTVKYAVELQPSGDSTIGELSVIFRTQSASLLEAMDRFFRLWKRTEDLYLAPRLGREIQCALYENRYVRQLAAPTKDCSVDELAETISGYVRMIDRLMKGYLAGRLSASDVAGQYDAEASQRKILI